MQSFQKLAALIVLMLFASKEAAASPQPRPPSLHQRPGHISSIGSPGGQVRVDSPSSANPDNRPTSSFPYSSPYKYPRTPSENNAAGTIDTVDNQLGVASRKVIPNLNTRDEIELEKHYPRSYSSYDSGSYGNSRYSNSDFEYGNPDGSSGSGSGGVSSGSGSVGSGSGSIISGSGNNPGPDNSDFSGYRGFNSYRGHNNYY